MTEAMEIGPRSKVLITGATGLVGTALSRVLREETGAEIIGVGSRDCDLRDGAATGELMDRVRPDFVFHLAARVHGLGGNARYKSDILFENVLINTNVVEYARRSGVRKIVAMGSGCVYPELKGQQELFEDQIWLGPPHSSEDSYAHAKRLMLAQLDAAREQYGLASAFVISGNLYGPHDLFNREDGHVTPSLVAKFHEAAQKGGPVKVWGSGVAVRDFTYCDDAARALLAIFRHLEGPVNMGSGMRHPIRDIVDTLHALTGVPVEWEADKPDGQLVRYYNLDRLASTGFAARVALRDGVRKTYEWYSANIDTARK
ncbi:MAG: NAD-dependent epimerase/dehydratase family protein [Pseudodesulfovibrio sp.]|uniref:NAD-dependent epimerase/dehydratase family protein n=1 Tax=Pseudodesulfovibrio sp. TaxID=2035812 RepID=UPI003D0DE07D